MYLTSYPQKTCHKSSVFPNMTFEITIIIIYRLIGKEKVLADLKHQNMKFLKTVFSDIKYRFYSPLPKHKEKF